MADLRSFSPGNPFSIVDFHLMSRDSCLLHSPWWSAVAVAVGLSFESFVSKSWSLCCCCCCFTSLELFSFNSTLNRCLSAFTFRDLQDVAQDVKTIEASSVFLILILLLVPRILKLLEMSWPQSVVTVTVSRPGTGQAGSQLRDSWTPCGNGTERRNRYNRFPKQFW